MTYTARAFSNQGRIFTDITKLAEEKNDAEISNSPLITFNPNEYVIVSPETLNDPVEVHTYKISQSIAHRIGEAVKRRIHQYADANMDNSILRSIRELEVEDQDVLDRAESFANILIEMSAEPEDERAFPDGLTDRQIIFAQHIFAHALVEVFSSSGFSSFEDYRIYASTVGSYINITEPSDCSVDMFSLNNLPAATPKITKVVGSGHLMLSIPVGL